MAGKRFGASPLWSLDGDEQISNHREPFHEAFLVRLKSRECF